MNTFLSLKDEKSWNISMICKPWWWFDCGMYNDCYYISIWKVLFKKKLVHVHVRVLKKAPIPFLTKEHFSFFK